MNISLFVYKFEYNLRRLLSVLLLIIVMLLFIFVKIIINVNWEARLSRNLFKHLN